MLLRRLGRGDASEYRTLMLEAYQRHPDAFTSTAAERAALPVEWWQSRVDDRPSAREMVWGCFSGDELVGVAGLSLEKREKIAHKSTLFGMYVEPGSRGFGCGDLLVQAVVRYAQTLEAVRIIQLTVSEGNTRARALYERHGFQQFGLEPFAVRVGTGWISKVHMWRSAEATLEETIDPVASSLSARS
jgi:RimJ/RimL family protein N-acetyltransferase